MIEKDLNHLYELVHAPIPWRLYVYCADILYTLEIPTWMQKGDERKTGAGKRNHPLLQFMFEISIPQTPDGLLGETR